MEMWIYFKYKKKITRWLTNLYFRIITRALTNNYNVTPPYASTRSIKTVNITNNHITFMFPLFQ